MSTLFQLTVGSTVYDLNDGNNQLSEYYPQPGNGFANVTESAVILMTASTVDNLISQLNAIQMAGPAAERRQLSKQGDRVFMKFRPNGAASTYRCEVFALDARVSEDPIWGLPNGLANRRIKMVIAYTRTGWKELDTLTALPLSNGNGASLTTGINVYDANDATGSSPNKLNNYVEIAAASILGVLPAPAYIYIANTFGASLRRVYIGHKAQGTPASFTHFLEAEAASLNALYAITALDPQCSGGSKITVTDMPAAGATIATWTISATQAGYILSQWIRLVARFEDLPTNATGKVRFILKDSTSGAQLAITDWTTLSAVDYAQQLGTLQFSVNLEGQVTKGAIKLVMEGKDAAAGCDFGLDYINLQPINLGSSYRFLQPIDEALVAVPATTGVLIDDMVDAQQVILEGFQDVYAGVGGPIMLIPNTINRLYFEFDGGDASAAIARLINVIVKYRPRVPTL